MTLLPQGCQGKCGSQRDESNDTGINSLPGHVYCSRSLRSRCLFDGAFSLWPSPIWLGQPSDSPCAARPERPLVRDVSPLKDLENLEMLDLSKTFVSDLSPLKNLKNLATLDLST